MVKTEGNRIHLEGYMEDINIKKVLEWFEIMNCSEYSSIELHISSGGGDMDYLQKLINIVASSIKPVNAFIHKSKKFRGVASSASVLCSYCNFVTIDHDAKFMIHHARVGGVVKEDEEDIYYWMEKTGQHYDIISELVKSEQWMDDETAYNLGFVDFIRFNKKK